jgi:hypothetical protein
MERNMSENFKFIAAGLSADGKIQVFTIEPNGELQTRWKTSADPNSSWTPWSNFQTPAGGVTTIGVTNLPDKRLQLFATEPSGKAVSCWKTTVDPNASWTAWSGF